MSVESEEMDRGATSLSAVLSNINGNVHHFKHRSSTIKINSGGTSVQPLKVIHLAGCPCNSGKKPMTVSDYNKECWDKRRGLKHKEEFDITLLENHSRYYWGSTTKIKHPVVCLYADDLIDGMDLTDSEKNKECPLCYCRDDDPNWSEDFDTSLRLLLDYSIDSTGVSFPTPFESLVVDDIVIPSDNYNDNIDLMELSIGEYNFEGLILQREKDGDSSFGGTSWVILRDNAFDNNSEHILLVEDEISLHKEIYIKGKNKGNIKKYKRFMKDDKFRISLKNKMYFPIYLKRKSMIWAKSLPLTIEEISLNNTLFKGVKTSTGSRNKRRHNFEINVYYDNSDFYSPGCPYPSDQTMWLQIININRWNHFLEKGTSIKLQSVDDNNGLSPKKNTDGGNILDEEYTITEKTAHIWVEIPNGLPPGRHRIRVFGKGPKGDILGEGCRILRIGD